MEDLIIVIQELPTEDVEAIAIRILTELEAFTPNWTDQPRQSIQGFLELADSARVRIREVANQAL